MKNYFKINWNWTIWQKKLALLIINQKIFHKKVNFLLYWLLGLLKVELKGVKVWNWLPAVVGGVDIVKLDERVWVSIFFPLG